MEVKGTEEGVKGEGEARANERAGDGCGSVADGK